MYIPKAVNMKSYCCSCSRESARPSWLKSKAGPVTTFTPLCRAAYLTSRVPRKKSQTSERREESSGRRTEILKMCREMNRRLTLELAVHRHNVARQQGVEPLLRRLIQIYDNRP